MRWPFHKDDARPAWDKGRAETLHGATVLVGLTLNEPTGRRLEQFYGTIMDADPDQGVILRREGSRSGEVYTLPPALRVFVRARPGSSRLRQPGEPVIDPDYPVTWDLPPPRQ